MDSNPERRSLRSILRRAWNCIEAHRDATIIVLVLTLIGLTADLTGEGIIPAIKRAFEKPKPMQGVIKIAVAGFEVQGDRAARKLGDDLAWNAAQDLENSIEDALQGLIVAVRGPDQVGRIHGQDRAARDANAAEIAARHDANLVVYGVIDATTEEWKLSPEFYITMNNAYESQEIVGAHDLGQPIDVGSATELAIIDTNHALSIRTGVLSNIAVGLVHYEARRYKEALDFYEKALHQDGWQDEQGKQVVYLLLGNCHLKIHEFDQARQNFEQAQRMNPAYARPYIGLGIWAYQQAIHRFTQSRVRSDIDTGLLQVSKLFYEQAARSPDRPDSADIDTKVHFGIGQIKMMIRFVDPGYSRDEARGEFEQVVQDYGNGANPRIRELAGESHAWLGLIHYEAKDYPAALTEYQLAIDLLNHICEQKVLYQSLITDIQMLQGTPGPFPSASPCQ